MAPPVWYALLVKKTWRHECLSSFSEENTSFDGKAKNIHQPDGILITNYGH